MSFYYVDIGRSISLPTSFAVDYIDVEAPADACAIIHWVRFFVQPGDEGDLNEEILELRYQMGANGGSSSAGGVGVNKLQEGDNAFGGTIDNFFTQASGNNIVMVHQWNIRLGYEYRAPEGRFVVTPGNHFIIENELRPSKGINVKGMLLVEERGG